MIKTIFGTEFEKVYDKNRYELLSHPVDKSLVAAVVVCVKTPKGRVSKFFQWYKVYEGGDNSAEKIVKALKEAPKQSFKFGNGYTYSEPMLVYGEVKEQDGTITSIEWSNEEHKNVLANKKKAA